MKITAQHVALVTALLGGGEMRLTMNRLETKVDTLETRVVRIERLIGDEHALALDDGPTIDRKNEVQ